MFEIIQREKQKDVSGLLQLLGIILGFVGMLLLVVYGEFDFNISPQGKYVL